MVMEYEIFNKPIFIITLVVIPTIILFYLTYRIDKNVEMKMQLDSSTERKLRWWEGIIYMMSYVYAVLWVFIVLFFILSLLPGGLEGTNETGCTKMYDTIGSSYECD
jgi:predicted CDP-diglyceride synthetase/phosphatidate cytidylyltransferase